MTRDEYVTSLVLDHGLTIDQVRQKVIEAGFDPLPPEESGQSKSARLKEELQHGVESTKAALRAQFGKLTFSDYDYDEGDTVMVAADFALNGKVWTLFGTAYEYQIDNYTIANLKNGATKEELAGVRVSDNYYGKPLVRKFVNEFMLTNESTHTLKEYRQEELNQMQKCDSLDTFAYQVQEQLSDNFFEIAHHKTKVNNVISHQFLLGPLFNDCKTCINYTHRDKWLKVLEEKNDNLFNVYYETTTNFGNDELLVVVCWNNEELERRTQTYEELRRTIQDAVDCGDFGDIDDKISDWRTARAYNNGNEYAYDESTKKEIDLPILEGKTFRHAITNPRDKRYIAGVEGYGPESDTKRMGVRDDAEAAAREAEEQDLEDFWGNDPQSYRNKYAPRFPWIQNDVPEDDLEGDEITALDYPSEEMLASWAEDDPSGMEHFEPEEDSAIAVLPADMDDEEVDDDVYY